MGINFDAVFDGFDEADPTGRGPKIQVAGKHVVEVKEVRLRESDNPSTAGHVFFVVEFSVLETDSADVVVGRQYTWTNDLMNQFFGQQNVKQFLAAILGFEPSSDEAAGLTKSHIREALENPDFFAGERVCVTTQPKTVKSGHPFTVHTWSPYQKAEASAS